ncbi:Clp protease N-terminal domain-containing protein [Actinokineospora auranticolor]|uniref:ATP-dependent Clp protease ATP-binding subunit ClpC n=1 Tax=Actinokineospora auranticolor TaxID=155976 RepID=A0A2S6GD08_9PSEU|nr:Clp protease N-terminal domain-containing protein [Actinokineospora auranticolor]PPK62566.1 ATP-dependent Clp protease ATP-binding subunit ClpC [Actinokineospora auranticolor]
MPKINVYLPDDLAEAVKESGVPVSAVCQRALEQSVKRVTAIRATVLGELASGDPTERLTQFTQRAREVIRLAVDRARADGAAQVGTEHLLHALLVEGTNLALHVLRAVEVDPTAITVPLSTGDGRADRFGGQAANALELAVTEAVSLGHNYIGCEHLLLGLLGEPDGAGGQTLRAAGADPRAVRAAVVAALAGYVHLRAQTGATDPAAAMAAALRKELAPILDRLTRLEESAGLAGA